MVQFVAIVVADSFGSDVDPGDHSDRRALLQSDGGILCSVVSSRLISRHFSSGSQLDLSPFGRPPSSSRWCNDVSHFDARVVADHFDHLGRCD